MAITLNIEGDIPEGLNLEPLQMVFERLAATQEADGEINLALVDDQTIREMNRAYAGNDYATDVLSFSYIEDGGEPIEGVIGEMAISLETAARQAEAAEMSLGDEIALLGLHGALHILGYDHQDEADRLLMNGLQGELMAAAGLKYREFEWKD
jgi:probable rRNA maturation factor